METLKPTFFEDQVISWLLSGEDPVIQAILKQYRQVTNIRRELTGYGFYLHFEIPNNLMAIHNHLPVKPDFSFGDVEALIPSLDNGAGFLLWVKDGCIEMLEGYTYDEVWPENITDFQLKYISGENRNWGYLRRQWSLISS